MAGDTSAGEIRVTLGATMFEVRDARIVRRTMYYHVGDSPLGR